MWRGVKSTLLLPLNDGLDILFIERVKSTPGVSGVELITFINVGS